MFAELANEDVPWSSVKIFQVDERVAPEGDPERNLTNLRDSLGSAPASVVAMPVNEPDLAAAAAEYAAGLPLHFDLVHLGLGPDGHTASLVPGDPVLEVTDRLVAVTQPYQGHERMTLTYPGLSRADELLWLISGADKKVPLAKLIRGDQSIPAGRVEARHSVSWPIPQRSEARGDDMSIVSVEPSRPMMIVETRSGEKSPCSTTPGTPCRYTANCSG